MDKIKSFMGSSSNKAQNEIKGLDKNVIDKAKTIKDSAQTKFNDYDDEFDVMDKAKSVQNKVPGIQGLTDKGNQMTQSLQSKGTDMLNKGNNMINKMNPTDYYDEQMAKQTDKLKSMLGIGSKTLLPKTKAGKLEDDVDSSREDIQYQAEAAKRNSINQSFKAGKLEDDLEDQKPVIKKSSLKGVRTQEFRASDLHEDEEIKIRLFKYNAGELEDEIQIKLKKAHKFRAGDLLDDIEERSPPKHDHDREHRELDELRRRNERLKEGNESLKCKNHDLEDELAREREKTRELKRRLQQAESSPVREIVIEREKERVESPIKKAAPRRPLGSPKTELYNPQSVRSPNKRPEPDSGHRPEQLSPGALIRKRIEEEDNLGGRPYENRPLERSSYENRPQERSSYESPSRNYQSNVTTPMEYFSPVKKETPNRNYPYSPELSIKSFKDHDLLPNATNALNLQLACLRDHEVLYEDDVIVVESQTQYVEGSRNSDPLLIVAFRYTNKTASELKDFTVTYKTIHNVVLNAENTDVVQRLGPRESQTHKLDAVLVGPVDAFGFMVIEYRSNNEPHQLKLQSPIVLTKFTKFQPISTPDFLRERKILQSQYPDNYEESSKIRLSQKNLRAIKENLLQNMTPLETDDERQGRFTIYGGSLRLSDIQGEALIRLIIENETQLVMVQLNYEDELHDYAKGLVGIVSFMCNEKAIL